MTHSRNYRCPFYGIIPGMLEYNSVLNFLLLNKTGVIRGCAEQCLDSNAADRGRHARCRYFYLLQCRRDQEQLAQFAQTSSSNVVIPKSVKRNG